MLVVVELNEKTLSVRYFDENLKSEKGGFSIFGFNQVIHKVRFYEMSLLITLADHQIIRIDSAAFLGKFLRLSFCDGWPQVNGFEVISFDAILDATSEVNWFMSVCEKENDIWAGNWKGDLFVKRNEAEFELKKKAAHSMGLTEVMVFKSYHNENRLLTASQDGTVKVWDDSGQLRLGQYNCSAEITAVVAFSSKMFVFGDKMGNLHLVKWHEYE